jgi:thioesterase domain-containing protein
VTDVERTGEFVVHFDFHEDVIGEEKREGVKAEYLRLLDAYLDNPEQPVEGFISHDIFTSQPIILFGSNGSEAEEVDLGRSGERVYVAPRNDLESQLVDVWEDVLGVKPVGVRDNFFDLGGSSWLALKLVAGMQEVIGQELPLTILIRAGTIEQLEKEIRKNEVPEPWSPLVPIRTHGNKRPFFCVHGAGGHVLFIASLVRYLDANQPIYAFQAQGIQADQEPLSHVEDMAALYLKVMKQVQPHGPYLLGGYSMGGMVAFEMAQQLIAQGEQVDTLVVIDTPAQSPQFRHLWNIMAWWASLVNMNQADRNDAFLSVRNYLFRLRYFFRLSLADKAAYIFNRGSAIGSRITRSLSQAVGGVEPGVDSDVVQFENIDIDRYRIRRLFAVNETAFRLYIPRKYPADIILFQSSDGYQDVDKDYSHIPNLGWNSVIQGKIDCFIVPGDHNQIVREPKVRILGEQLRQVLENVERK